MAFKTFTAGAVLTASDVNTYLMKQSVIVCTSGTRPSSPVEGMMIVETDTDRVLVYDGSAWQRLAYYSATGRTALRLRRVANQSIATATTTDITWDTEDADSDTLFTAPGTTITGTSTAGTGFWIASAFVTWASDPGTSTALWMEWTKPAVATLYTTTEEGSAARPGTGSTWWTGITGGMNWGSTSTLVVKVRQSSGASINLTGFLEMFKLAI